MLVLLVLRLAAFTLYIVMITTLQVLALLFTPLRVCCRSPLQDVKAADLEKFLANEAQAIVEFNSPMWSRLSATSMLMHVVFGSFARSAQDVVCVRCTDMSLDNVRQLAMTPELFWFPIFVVMKHGHAQGCSSGYTYTTTSDLESLTAGKGRSSDDHPWKVGTCGGP